MSKPGNIRVRLLATAACALCAAAPGSAAFAQTRDASASAAAPTFTMSPIGWVRKHDGKTFIVVEPRYQPALLGVADLSSLWVLYWFDRNDTPDRRAILQVHPRGDPARPLRGVFATRAPVRPNLIALSEVRVLSVRDNVIEIDDIDAFPDTPVLDLKP
ncbi:MAG: SAM-dependent methyltransferase [Gammaproteobacteria bacterium]|nr:SAM-dependent methyltransferase [Gammaproteobacteria bacterium]MBU1414127.1 SAM-dependent methyltransferase [Gammaproteobacteria bacterium]